VRLAKRLQLGAAVVAACALMTGSLGGANAQVTDREPFKAAPNINEAMVGHYNLPDPLTTLDGNRVRTVAEWEKVRRPEIFKLFEENQFGVTPKGGPKAKFEAWEKAVPALKGKALRTQVRISFSDDPNAPVIHLLLYIPANAKESVPVLEHLSFSPNVLAVEDTGIEEGYAWDMTSKTRIPGSKGRKIGGFDPLPLLNKGIGVALFFYGEVDPDFGGGTKDGVRALFGTEDAKRTSDEWGTIGGWAWGASRVLDYLETDPRVDAKKVAISGASRLGKATLWTGAQDQRFAIVVPIISGEGGAALSRRNYGETIADLTHPERYPYWFAPNYKTWAAQVDRFPVDSHMLLALIAPRPLLLINGQTDTWSDWRGEYLAARAAEPVYALYGKTGLQSPTEPVAGKIILNDIGFFKHPEGHLVTPADMDVIASFMQKHFATGAKKK
jgi:hypothetical protein